MKREYLQAKLGRDLYRGLMNLRGDTNLEVT
jgi:hypothetical protein